MIGKCYDGEGVIKVEKRTKRLGAFVCRVCIVW